MNKARLWKSTVCMTSALVMMMSVNTTSVNAAPETESIAVSAPLDGTTNSLAGITLSLDNYYTATLNAAEEERAAAEAAAQESAQNQPVSKYANTGIAIVDKYVNVREKATTDSEIVGKLYKGGAVKIVSTEGEWVNIESGSVKGYISKEYLAIGEEAEKVADKYMSVKAVIKTETLRLREKASTDSKTLTLLSQEEKYTVKSQEGDWVQVQVDDNLTGYVAKEFVKVKEKFGHAVSIKEEREAEEKKAAQEAAIRAQEEANRASSTTSSTTTTTTTTTSKKTTTSSKKTNSSSSATTNSVSTSKSGSAVASYALNFVGNKYRWGGTSLTNGADCSGFTMSVYKHFGISIPRTASAQAGAGKKVSLSELQPGDLLFYGSGSISHVGMYIGGGQIVHASNRKDGIKKSNYKYSTPICARRML